jgi:hypothetical protein
MNFQQTITAAIKDIEDHGYDSQARIDGWMSAIDRAAREAMMPEAQVQDLLNRTIRGIYSRMVDKGGMLSLHKGISAFKLEMIRPKLRAELERRMMASASLIKLNREQMIAKTRQRFVGWSTSIPAGGSNAVDKADVKADLRKALKQLPYEERRVLIDQGHKFTAALNNIVAVDGGAIAVEWHSHYLQAGYNYRPDHKERSGKIYLIRDNWAQIKGLVKAGKAGYYDSITAVGEEVFCRCFATYVYSLRSLPGDMLTTKGREALKVG